MGILGVLAEGLFGLEMQIALDGEALGAAEGLKIRYADVAELREAHTEVAETKGDVRVGGVELREEPGALCVRGEELHDGREVDECFAVLCCSLLCSVLE